MRMPVTLEAIVHSKKDLDTVTILEHPDNNNVVAEYNGIRCTAIFNVFNGFYYVDDLYGVIKD